MPPLGMPPPRSRSPPPPAAARARLPPVAAPALACSTATPASMHPQGQVVKAVIVETKKEVQRKDGRCARCCGRRPPLVGHALPPALAAVATHSRAIPPPCLPSLPQRSVIKFDKNSAVLVNQKGLPIGTRVLGFVTHELRARQMMKVGAGGYGAGGSMPQAAWRACGRGLHAHMPVPAAPPRLDAAQSGITPALCCIPPHCRRSCRSRRACSEQQ